ncbi:MAG: hypothetical protein MUC43_17310 [Pirellula sp.]|nr:hypothetical protein [Pirellula sp.]
MKMTPVTTEMLERWNQFKGILPAPSMIESQPTIPNGMNGIDGTLPSPIEEPLANPQQYETVLAVPSSSQARLP